MVYELIAEKLKTLKDTRRKVSHDQSSHVNLFKNRLSEIKAAQEKLVDLMMDGKTEPDMLTLLNQRAKKLAEESREVVAKIEETEQNYTEILRSASLSKRWVKATYEERRAVCQLLIREIRMDAAGNAEVVWNI